MTSGARTAAKDGETGVLPYFATLGLDLDEEFVDAYASYRSASKRQLETAANYVPAKQALSEAETRQLAAKKWKQLDDDFRTSKKKDGR